LETIRNTIRGQRVRESVTVRRSPAPSDVFARERQDQIVGIVEEDGRARVSNLAARFEVSGVTIRKDLVLLEAERRLVRTHGGAIAVTRSRPELSFEIRERLQADEKELIGAAAAGLVGDGESIVLDASTTALSLGRHLKARGGWTQLTVITNGLRLASTSRRHSWAPRDSPSNPASPMRRTRKPRSNAPWSPLPAR
jgi:DeoR/GlpR family transcriptional regulator of sugar metabolism